jgi:hypothetical protein
MAEKAPSLDGTFIGVENDENLVKPTTSHDDNDGLEAGEDEEDTTSHDDASRSSASAVSSEASPAPPESTKVEELQARVAELEAQLQDAQSRVKELEIVLQEYKDDLEADIPPPVFTCHVCQVDGTPIIIIMKNIRPTQFHHPSQKEVRDAFHHFVMKRCGCKVHGWCVKPGTEFLKYPSTDGMPFLRKTRAWNTEDDVGPFCPACDQPLNSTWEMQRPRPPWGGYSPTTTTTTKRKAPCVNVPFGTFQPYETRAAEAAAKATEMKSTPKGQKEEKGAGEAGMAEVVAEGTEKYY